MNSRLTFEDALTLPMLLNRSVQNHGEKLAIQVDDDTVTFNELNEQTAIVAENLRALGLGRGDRIGILMQNSLDLVTLMFGAARIGVMAVVFNARFAPGELRYVLHDAEVSHLFVGHHGSPVVDLPGRVAEALPGHFESELQPQTSISRMFVFGASEPVPGFEPVEAFFTKTSVDWQALKESEDTVTPSDIYIMLYTSGTTSNPKGCLIKHESMVSNGMMVGREGFELTGEDVMWNTLPMFHVSSLTPLHSTLDAGGAFISALHYDADEALNVIEENRCSIIFPSYPAVMQPLITAMSKQNRPLEHVRVALTAGPPENLMTYQEQLPSHVIHISCYGSTEIGGIATIGRLSDPLEERVATGKPLSGFTFQVRDMETGEVLGANETGALWVKSPYLFVAYNNDPQKTAESFDVDGWFDTGDLGTIDEHGNVFHRGRSKDMLKVGGENVAAAEVEAVLLSHPSVAIAAVVGKPDDRYQEVPVAFVELQPGHRLDEGALKLHCESKLAKYKQPREIYEVNEWPMSATKIQKFRLLDQIP